MTDFAWALIVDALLIAVVVFAVCKAARKGFAYTVVELVGYILSATIAFSLAGVIAETVYDNNMRPGIVSSVQKSITDNSEIKNIDKAVDEIWDSIPSFITSLAFANGIDKNKISSSLSASAQSGSGNAAAILADNVIKPVAVSGIKMLLSSVIFVLLMILVRIFARTLNKAFNISLLRPVNKILGGVFGLLKGGVIIMIIVTLIGFALPLFGNKIWFITPEFIDKTYVFKLLYNSNPFINHF